MTNLYPIRFHDADKAEMGKIYLRQYFIWFMESIPSTISRLQTKVREDMKFAQWEASLSRESFEILCIWHAQHLGTMIEDKVEINFENGTSAIVDTHYFSDKTYSQVMDVGVYFGECLRHEFKQLKWVQLLTAKRWIDYGEPILTGFAKKKTRNIRRNSLVISSRIAKQMAAAHDFIVMYQQIASEVESE